MVSWVYFKGVGVLFIFVIKGGYDVVVKLVDYLKLFSYVVNLGDVWLLVIYLVLIIYSQLIEDQKIVVGVGLDVVCLFIGIEDVVDIIVDLDQVLVKVMV